MSGSRVRSHRRLVPLAAGGLLLLGSAPSPGAAQSDEWATPGEVYEQGPGRAGGSRVAGGSASSWLSPRALVQLSHGVGEYVSNQVDIAADAEDRLHLVYADIGADRVTYGTSEDNGVTWKLDAPLADGAHEDLPIDVTGAI